MRKPNRFVYYNRELQPVAEADLKGKIYAKGPPILWIFWPLEVGKNLKQDVEWENLRTGKKIEIVSTPVGDFLAYKIISVHGNSWYERWYSPKAKNYVKMIDHLSDDTFESLLINYQLSDRSLLKLKCQTSLLT